VINRNFDEFTPYFCADINDVVITFRTLASTHNEHSTLYSLWEAPLAEKSMHPTSILCLNHVFFIENGFN